MKFAQLMLFVSTATVGVVSSASDFSFDRPGTGFGTSITPVGSLAWEQGLPTATYTEAHRDNDQTQQVTLQGDMLLRTGIASNTELQLGWAGPMWNKTTKNGQKHDESGLGDVSVGVKHAIDLHDDRMSMALLAQALIATGNDGYSAHDDIYSLASSVQYKQNDLLTTGITMRYEIQNSNWAVTAIPTLSYKIIDKWSGYSEFVYRKQESEHYQSSLNTGLIYAVNNNVQLDASIGAGLSGDVPDYKGGFGVSFLF